MRFVPHGVMLAFFILIADPAHAEDAATLTMTTYDDGFSCPGDCDAHVVFRKQHNGTRNAFLPAVGADPLANRANAAQFPCVKGKECVVCFAEAKESCIVTTYRGTGPPLGRVDATPAFMKEWCDKPALPEAIATECKRLKGNAASLAARINCIAEPSHEKCKAKMDAAAAAKTADAPEFQKCVAMGVAKYNAQQSDANLHRSLEADCPYYQNQRQTNSNGVSWQKLSPGACREGYFVGPNGTDCCSRDTMQAAVDFLECRWFYPTP
jgi:hypothetical protein